MTDFEKSLFTKPSTEEVERGAAEVRDCQATFNKALADPSPENIAALTKVASRLRNVGAKAELEKQFANLQSTCLFFLNQDRELPFAMEAAQYMIRLARTQDRKPQLLNGLFVQAMIASQLDNHIEAVEACCNARETANAIGSPIGELKAVLNGAAVYINFGDYSGALELLRSALTISERCSMEEAANLEWKVLINIAQCHLFLENFEEGLRTAYAARTLAPAPSDSIIASIRAIIEFSILRLLFAMGRGSETRPVLDKMAEFVAQAGSPRARIDLKTARGLVAIAEGNREVGFSLLASAIEQSNVITSTMPDVLNALIAAYRSQGMDEEVRKAQAQLSAVLANRQQTARLRAALLPHQVGVTGRTGRVSEYDRRLDAARERLLRSASG